MAHELPESSSPMTPSAPDAFNTVHPPTRAQSEAMPPSDTSDASDASNASNASNASDAAVPHEPPPSALPVGWRWLQANTFVPTWLPLRWRHPAAGYILAALVQVVVALISRLLTQFVPTYAFPGVVEIVAVALIALSWGAGPGVFAALMGLVLEETFVLPLRGDEGPFTGADLIEGVLFMAVGIGISVVASRAERFRRQAVEERAEAQAREAQARESALRQTQERMDEWLAIASHDLRSPVAAVMGYNHLAAHRYERLACVVLDTRPDLADQIAAVRARMSDASQSSERLHRLVDILFDTTQAHAGKLELHRAPSDLWAVVREQVEALQVANPHRTVHLELAGKGSEQAEVDSDRIGQVVNNYVTNALKYSPADQPVAVRVARNGPWARVSVEDHGPGLPESEQERIWGRFYQTTEVRAQSGLGAGLGLGLYISKAIIEGHGGKVGVESRVGEGSAFWFTLPLANGSSQTAA